MKTKYIGSLAAILTTVLAIIGCNKILDEASNKKMIVPKSLADFQSILDYPTQMNHLAPTVDEFLSDDYYITDETYDGFVNSQKNVYTWGTDPYNGPFNDWGKAYDEIYYCNVALEGIAEIKKNKKNAVAWNNVMGSALFFRAKAFLHLAFIYCQTYDQSTAAKDYGIVIRTSSNFNQKSTRANLKESYNKIIGDLKVAANLLPDLAITPFRPSKAATYALLARTYLSMRNYTNAGKYADSSLRIKGDLMNYNTLDTNALFPFPVQNPELLFQQYSCCGPVIGAIRTRIDTVLYTRYQVGDLRKAIFFYPLPPGHYFKGHYSGEFQSVFTGLATDEVYLTRAECFARANKVKEALADLNLLLKNRFKNDSFVPVNESDPKKLLSLILDERRKELVYRCLRWMDIKRLNKEGAEISLQRKIHGKSYILPPIDSRYAYPIPTDIIEQTGMPQNPL